MLGQTHAPVPPLPRATARMTHLSATASPAWADVRMRREPPSQLLSAVSESESDAGQRQHAAAVFMQMLQPACEMCRHAFALPLAPPAARVATC